MKNVARRRYITALAASGVGILAGCASDESSSNTSQPQQNQKNDSNGNTESQNSNPNENTEAQNDEPTENAKATKKGSATVRSTDFILGDSAVLNRC
ncbi:hypothetical protein HYG81_20090 (plasmid) [Natrinema zhouii]|uniref:hypothetical protein n=1 Tax=Natrinema zhouii TaxID=1710539 RepID=UPI001D00130E|nr:hypothetical protein [Natrinema zhouii]UHQ98363.1 hypothetical protein HYG81_20090 [Natrinema zhouii]